jgi:catalase
MPLPNDERIVKLAEDLLAQFEVIFGAHPGFRPAHARGIMLSGTFTPSAEAAKLCKAPHFVREQTPVSVRFSSSTGLPLIPDTNPKANPRGMAIRFHLAERVHTDIISHSADGFPTRTGEEFLEFLKAVVGKPGEIEAFLATHPGAARFVQLPKPFPASYATEAYFGVTAAEFENAEGAKRFGRYRVVPEAGVHYVEPEGLSETYLLDEINTRLETVTLGFKVCLQLAETGDVVDDATSIWPETRELVEMGKIELNEILADDVAKQKHLIFDPIPRVEGIEPSADPLLELRAAVYLISGRKRRAA